MTPAASTGQDPATDDEPCHKCGEALVPGAAFCEACGTPTGQVAAITAPATDAKDDEDLPRVDGTATSAQDGIPCDRCGGVIGADDYCTTCGVRSLGPVTVDDRGRSAYATHRGVRHPRNEDAAGLAATSEGYPVVVVVDGVSASPNPHLAAAAAVSAAANRLAGRAFMGPDDVVDAVAEAHSAASAVPADGDPFWKSDGAHPACTIVVAVATSARIHMANVGDARGYVVRTNAVGWSSQQMTTDDSVAAQAVAHGVAPAAALALPDGHAITAWLGSDAPPPSPHVADVEVTAGDMLLVCSDGLWNYAPTSAELDQLLRHTVPLDSGSTALGPSCESLVRWAIDQGGADNISVALAPISEERQT